MARAVTSSLYSGTMVTSERGIRVNSIAQQSAWREGGTAAPEEIRPGLWAVCVPMFSDAMPWTLGYAMLGDDGVHIIDPGWDGESNLRVWEEFLREHDRELRDVRTLLITHGHIDHVGLADRIRRICGAEVVMSHIEAELQRGPTMTSVFDRDAVAARLSRWGVPGEVQTKQLEDFASASPPPTVEPDRTIGDGDTVSLATFHLRAILTPGHTNGHLCFVEETAGVLLTGDHVLPEINPGLGLGSRGENDPLVDYLESLRRVAQYDDYEALPGHEWRFTGIAERCAKLASHHLRRTRAIASLVSELGNAPVWEYASRSPWSRGWENMQGFHLHSALAQTELHLDSVQSGRAGEWLNGSWPPATKE